MAEDMVEVVAYDRSFEVARARGNVGAAFVTLDERRREVRFDGAAVNLLEVRPDFLAEVRDHLPRPLRKVHRTFGNFGRAPDG